MNLFAAFWFACFCASVTGVVVVAVDELARRIARRRVARAKRGTVGGRIVLDTTAFDEGFRRVQAALDDSRKSQP